MIFLATAGHCRKGNGQWPGRLALIMFGDRTKKPLPIAIRAVAVNSKTGGKLKLKNSLIRITSLNSFLRNYNDSTITLTGAPVTLGLITRYETSFPDGLMNCTFVAYEPVAL